MRVVTGGRRPTAKVWDARSGAEVFTLKGHTDWVNSASFSPDGTRIVTGGNDLMAKVWDARSGAEVLALKGHASRLIGADIPDVVMIGDIPFVGVNSASFSPDGARVVTAGGDGTAKVWDARSGAEVLALKGHAGAVRTAGFSPDGARVVTASEDGTAKVWDAATGAEVLALKGHTGVVTSAGFSPDGSRMVTASEDHTAKVWDAATGAEVLAPQGAHRGRHFGRFQPGRLANGHRE